MPTRFARILPLAAIAILYLAACRIILAPIGNFAHFGSASYEGDARLIIWTLAWDNHAVVDGVRPFFDANMFYPASDALAYSEHLVGVSLFSLPVYAVTRNPVLAYNVVWLLAYFLSAAAAHLLAWRHTRDHLAATVGGLIYAFCFFRMHHGHHLHLIWSFWIPVSLVAMDAWVATLSWRRLAVFVAVLILQATASWYQAVMIVVANTVWLFWLLVVERVIASNQRARFTRLFGQAAIGAAIALSVVWVLARHYTVLHSGGPAEVVSGAADLTGYLMPPQNTIVGRWLVAHGVKGPRWIWGELTTYLGWITMALATIGVIAAIRTPALRRTRVFIVLAIVAVALAAGPSSSEVAAGAWGWSPFGMLARIPGVALFRVPARFTGLLTLALAMLAAAGCAALHLRFGRAGRLATLVAIPLLLAESYVVDFPGGPPAPFPIPRVYTFIASLPPGAVVSLPDLSGTPLWFQEADYQYFSTRHWHPIANGYSRAEPPGFRGLMDHLKTFPDPASFAAMREVGIRYVVLHGRRAPAQVAPARASTESRLIARFDDDYLFEVDLATGENGVHQDSSNQQPSGFCDLQRDSQTARLGVRLGAAHDDEVGPETSVGAARQRCCEHLFAGYHAIGLRCPTAVPRTFRDPRRSGQGTPPWPAQDNGSPSDVCDGVDRARIDDGVVRHGRSRDWPHLSHHARA